MNLRKLATLSLGWADYSPSSLRLLLSNSLSSHFTSQGKQVLSALLYQGSDRERTPSISSQHSRLLVNSGNLISFHAACNMFLNQHQHIRALLWEKETMSSIFLSKGVTDWRKYYLIWITFNFKRQNFRFCPQWYKARFLNVST